MKKKLKKLKEAHVRNKYSVIAYIAAFAVIGGIIMLFVTRAATPVSIDNTLPNPTNVKVFADDRIATITWTPPDNASSRGIVGYYVTWGTQSGGIYTNAKQTTYNETQIQPLTNGTVYNVKVQSVQGNHVSVPVTGSWEEGGSQATEARANGKVSPGVTLSVTPTSARVDQMRQQLTGFFDDFNTPAGGFDESKWNTAQSSCVAVGAGGSFINAQFHSHTQVRSDCDRAQIINRPRAVFDITGRTEANPGVVAFDFDGVSHGRDAWYIDFIPTTARKNGIPLDITSHASIFDDEPSDPSMLRFEQLNDKVLFVYYDRNKVPHQITPTFSCPDWGSPASLPGGCSKTPGQQVPGLSPLPEPTTTSDCPDWAPNCLNPISNFRRHWIIHISSTKIKLFLDGMLFWEGPMPAELASVNKYTIHNNLFSYNTGKGDDTLPATSLLHWDNFGFNGPAPNTVVHNYLEGGVTGTVPYLGRGNEANQLPEAPRNIKLNIPDNIGSPVQARFMFTLNNDGPDNYHWSSDDHIIVNGKRYNYSNPALNEQAPILKEWDGTDLVGSNYVPFADGIIINAADLRRGINDIALNIGANVRYNGIFNVHIELEYTKGTQPTYTQPSTIFGASIYNAMFQPTMSSHDNYLFIEQDMGLPTGVIATTPGSTDTTPPSINITSPTNGTSFSKGDTINLAITATDNVAVDKVVLYLDGGANPYHTITHSPFDHTLETSNMSTGNHTIYARVFDTSGLQNQSATINFTVTDPAPDPDPVTIPGDLNGDGKVNVFDLSTLLSNWGRTGATKSQGDVDGNGTVNIFDMSTLLANWSR